MQCSSRHLACERDSYTVLASISETTYCFSNISLRAQHPSGIELSEILETEDAFEPSNCSLTFS